MNGQAGNTSGVPGGYNQQTGNLFEGYNASPTNNPAGSSYGLPPNSTAPSVTNNPNPNPNVNPYALQQMMALQQRRQQLANNSNPTPEQIQQLTQLSMFQNAVSSAAAGGNAATTPMGPEAQAQAAMIRQRLAQALMAQQQQQQQQQQGFVNQPMQGQGQMQGQQGQMQRSQTPSSHSQLAGQQGMAYWNTGDGFAGLQQQQQQQHQQQQQQIQNAQQQQGPTGNMNNVNPSFAGGQQPGTNAGAGVMNPNMMGMNMNMGGTGTGMVPAMDRQWMQQSLRAQNHQQAQVQAMALAQARAGTPGGAAGVGAAGTGATGAGGGMQQWNAQNQFQQQQQQQQQQQVPQQQQQQQLAMQQQNTPSSQHQNVPQSALTPGGGGSSAGVGAGAGRMSVPPRPSSAASAHSQFSTSFQQQQQQQQRQGSVQGTPTPSLQKHTLGGGAGGMQQGGMNVNMGMGANMGMGGGMGIGMGGQYGNQNMAAGMGPGMGMNTPMAMQMQQQQMQMRQQQQQQGASAQSGYKQGGTGNLQQSPGQQQHPQNHQSPMFAQPMMGGNHLGLPPQMASSQSPAPQSTGPPMGNGNLGNNSFGASSSSSMGPPPQRGQTPYQQFQVSPASATPGTAGSMGMGMGMGMGMNMGMGGGMGMGTPTPTSASGNTMTGKRKTPGADVSSSREQSLAAGGGDYQTTPGSGAESRKDGSGSGSTTTKAAKQPRKKKEKEEKPPAKPSKKWPLKTTKGQVKTLDEHTQRQRAAELATAGAGDATTPLSTTTAEGTQAVQVKEEQSQSLGMPPPPPSAEGVERSATTPAFATPSQPSNFQQAQLELERIQQAQAQRPPSSASAAPPQPQVNANSDHSPMSINNTAAAMYHALKDTPWPFEPKIVLHVKSVMQNPQTFPMLIARDPSLQKPIMEAVALIRAGKVTSEMLGNMHKYAAACAHLQQQQRVAQQQMQAQRLSQSSQPPMTPRSPPPPPSAGSVVPPDASQQPAPRAALANTIMSQIPPQMHHLAQRRDSQSSMRQNLPETVNARPLSGNPALAPPPLSAGLPTDGGPIAPHADAAAKLPPTTPAPTRVAVPPPPPMEEWQKYLPNLPGMTSIAPLPQSIDERDDPTFGGALPVLTDEQLYQYRAWLDKDVEYARTLELQRARSANMVAEWLDKDVRPAWWQMDVRGERPNISERMSIIWPIEKKSARANKRPQKGKVRKTMAEYYTKAEVKAAANIPERLVPIRLDIDVTDTNEEHRRYRDTFLWNAADTVAKLDKFVDTICEDFQIRPDKFKDKIRGAIEEQIKQGEFLLTLPGDDDPPGLSQEDYDWWQGQRLAVIEGDQDTADLIEDEVTEDNDVADDLDERPETVDALMADLQEQDSSEDLRIKIQLDIVSGAMHLSDSFEWELTSPVSPEEFAEVYAAELGLNGEFKTAIAHDIREQVYVYTKSLAMVGYTFDGGVVSDLELRQEFLPPVTDVVRRDEQSIATHTPFLVNITDADIERLETEREKLISKKKRATRGRRGVILPDREPMRTVRMRVGGEVDENGRVLARVNGPKQPFVVKPSTTKKPVTSRRAAAVAARANISEMSNDVGDDKYDLVAAPLTNIRLKRNRPSAMTPGLQLEDPSSATRVSSRISDRLVPKEERMSVPPDARSAKTTANGSESRQGSVRPIEKSRVSSKDGPSKPPGTRSRDDSPAPFPDVASPESTSSSSADGAFALSRAKSQAKRSSKNDRKIQTPLAQSSKPLPGSTPDTSKPRSSTGRVSESPAKTTPVLSNLAIPPNRPPAHRVVSHQPPQPPWLIQLLADLAVKRPREKVQATWKGPPANVPPGTVITEVDNWRIKCLDCMGKIYSLGPGQTLDNFEKHLRNKQHLANVDARLGSSQPA